MGAEQGEFARELSGNLLPASLNFFRSREATDGALRVIFVTAQLLSPGAGHRLHHLLAARAAGFGEGTDLPATRRADEGLQCDCFHPVNSSNTREAELVRGVNRNKRRNRPPQRPVTPSATIFAETADERREARVEALFATDRLPRYSAGVPRWFANLREVISADRLSDRLADLDAASRDESSLAPSRPEAVAWPLSSEEVSAIVRVARGACVPITARGAGTSLEGNPIPIRGGLVVDFSRMNRIIEVRPPDLVVRVEPGVVYEQLNHELRPHGLFFPHSPGGSSDTATIGGMLANDASGIYSVNYG